MPELLDDQATYDEIPYPVTLCYPQTHPDRLATIARLLGLDIPPIDNCRILELGCASGGNIIPMAASLPGSQFLGIDFSANQVKAGQQAIAALGLKNVRIEQVDILTIGPDFGQFDYIIAHGVYSWVPPDVRDKVLVVCKQNLAPNGIAYVSYNALPGWYMLRVSREMMRYHTRDIPDLKTSIDEARQILNFVAQYVANDDGPYSSFLNSYADLLQRQHTSASELEDATLVHADLSPYNYAFYFHEFMASAQQNGLQYVSEANFPQVMPLNLKPPAPQMLQRVARDVIDMEQYMDFLRNRTFRQTILCHQGIEINRSLSPDPAQMRDFYITSRTEPVETEVDLGQDVVVQFRGRDKTILATGHSVSKAALLHLAEVWPQAVAFDDLLEIARQRVGEANTLPLEHDAQGLAVNLLRGYTYSLKLVELHIHAKQFTRQISERPLATGIARYHAAQGFRVVANARHGRVTLDPLSQHLLPWLDGQHDRPALLEKLVGLVKSGRIGFQEDGSQAEAEQILAEELDAALEFIAGNALLIE